MNDMSTEQLLPTQANGTSMFSFGDAESVINGRELWSYFEMYQNGDYYEPPLPMAQLAKAFNMTPHHRSALAFKVNLLVKHMVPSRWIDKKNFERFAMNFLQMGNGYLERVDNMAGRPMSLVNSPAIFTRVGVQSGKFFFVKGGFGEQHEFQPDSVFHLFQPEMQQEIYGVPEWISALQSGLLNENATLFRRRYYLNGAHAGFVFYVSEALADKETVDAMKDRLTSAKGVGNFKNLFVNIPNGKKGGIEILPIADVAAKDEFQNVKNITRDDLLAAHRMPPQLIGIIPQNNGGFGDVGKATDVFFANEIEPIIERMLQLNDWLGVRALDFKPYEKQAGPTPPAPASR
jgi:PBSX family phage portal protein